MPSSFERRMSKKFLKRKIGATGFEPAATSTPYWCASQAALRPDYHVLSFWKLIIHHFRQLYKASGANFLVENRNCFWYYGCLTVPSSSGLGRRPLTPKTRVRTSLGPPMKTRCRL